MDCCNYGEWRQAGYAGGGGAGAWEPYSPYAFAPYSHGYYAPHAHDPYARYAAYRYDYPLPHHAHHNDHAMPMDYGPYSSKEMRVRRALARRDARARTPIQHLPLPPTPPLECGVVGRAPTYCEPQMWHHYQMGVSNGGWNGGSSADAWASRNLPCSRDQMRYSNDFRSMKGAHPHASSIAYQPDGRSTPYSIYEESPYGDAAAAAAAAATAAAARARVCRPAEPPAEAAVPETPRPPRPEPRLEPPQDKRPALVPLPAFQQAFGSTEIGKFAEAFSRTEVALGDSEAFSYDSFPDWEPEPQWSAQPTREIKCEDTF